VVSTKALGVEYEKRLSSQRETSIRLAYPLLGRSMLLVAGAVVLLCLAIMPYGVLAAGLVGLPVAGQLLAVSGVAVCVQLATYAVYLGRIRARGCTYGALFFPLVLAQELYLVILSAVRYSRQTITWKGRPVENKVQA